MQDGPRYWDNRMSLKRVAEEGEEEERSRRRRRAGPEATV